LTLDMEIPADFTLWIPANIYIRPMRNGGIKSISKISSRIKKISPAFLGRQSWTLGLSFFAESAAIGG
jgi:hypothetical protein